MPYTEIQRKQLKVILKKRELVKRVKSYLLGESEITLSGQIRPELQHESDEIKNIKKEVMKEIKVPPNVKYAELFQKQYREARENKRGLWK